MPRLRVPLTLAFILLPVLAAAQAPAPAAGPFDNLRFRGIGPATMSGRIDDVAVLERNPAVFYVGTATGGVWKTTNMGTTFEPVFDKEGTSSIGDVAIAPSDANLVWVGTGENNNRQNSSWGDGVYKS
ncbi:MAG: glycosyl hydrolase, partial [Gemmatimonadota bacterium]|nr:glycosyl hydrolase [Gemmatimonadota bacterium]